MRINPNTILSSIALFLALGGGAYAAVSVTGRDIENGSLTGRDLRDGSIRAADLAAKVRRAGDPGTAGPAGPQGPGGAPGPAGQPGADGSSQAISTRVSEALIGTGGSTAVIGGLVLPAGSWVIDTAGVLAHFESTPQSARCQVLASFPGFEEELGETGTVPLPAGGGLGTRVPFAVTGAITLDSSTEVTLSCSTSRTSAIRVQDLGMTAIQVAALEKQT